MNRPAERIDEPRPAARSGYRILVVDDERNMRRVLQAILEGHGHAVDAAGDGDEARALLRRAQPSYDLVVTDLRMPNCDGMQLLKTATRVHADTPVVVLTAHGTVDLAVEAMREGAYDFITKPFDDNELSAVITRALSRREANRERAYEPQDDDTVPWRPGPTEARLADDVLSELIGSSDALQQVFALVRKVAPSPTTLLIRGESGTGKELVANAVHKLSPRRGMPFVAVNCTAIPEALFESELFGHEKGAFTGAVTARPGRFELANGGTLFLDEIGELPPAMQVKLLRVLQERAVERIGGLRPEAVDVRLVAATNAPLEDLVRTGAFREDLFYRLNVVPIMLPPLRERRGDIPGLIRHFVDKFSRRLDRDVRDVHPDALGALIGFAWPGNIRQLENVVERMVLLAEGSLLTLADVPPEIRGARTLPNDEAIPNGPLKEVIKAHTERVERELIVRALLDADWNVTHAARRLGISRKGLQLKMRDYDLRPREADA